MSDIQRLLYEVPNNIKSKIELDAITLLKKSVGWQRIHYEIMFPKNRRNKVQDIFSMDEYGKYLDDECGKITYW